MMARPVAEYLAYFGPDPDTLPHAEGNLDFAPMPLAVMPASLPSWFADEAPPPEKEDPALLMEAAREAGRDEGIETARAEFALEIENQRQAHAAELAAARQKWADEEGSALRAAFDGGLRDIETRIADILGRVLQPFIVEAWRGQMLAELLQNLTSLVESQEAISLDVAGPADLIEILREKLDGTSAHIAYEVADSPDVKVRIGETSIETQFSAWIARFSAEME